MNKEVVFSAQVFINILGQDDTFVKMDYPIHRLEYDIYISKDIIMRKQVIDYCKKFNLITIVDQDFIRIRPIVLEIVDRGLDYLDEEKFDEYLRLNYKHWELDQEK